MTEPENKQDIEIIGDGNIVGDRNVSTVVKLIVNFFDEKVFRRLGIEQRIGFILLGVLIIGCAVGLYFALREKKSPIMPGDFRIAVAGFSENGRSRKSELGMQLAEDVYLRLEENFASAELDFVVTVWGPNRVGMIRGRDQQERATAAAQLADEIDADIIVYGSVDTSDALWEVNTEFYVSARNFYQAAEVVGKYGIGYPFRVTAEQGPVRRLAINNQLAARTNVLFRIIMGLVNFQLQDYASALEQFTSATTMISIEDKGVRQVLYLWLGNTAGRMVKLDIIETHRYLDEAETYHRQAIELDPDYARPYIGLAGVYYLRALLPFQESLEPMDIDAAWLHLAIETYHHALQAKNHPPLSDIEIKVHFGLGQCYTMLVYSGNELYFDAAIAEFEAVIAAYNDGDNPRVREQAAESHARLGLIYCFLGEDTASITEYELSVLLLPESPDRQEIYKKAIEHIRSEGCAQ